MLTEFNKRDLYYWCGRLHIVRNKSINQQINSSIGTGIATCLYRLGHHQEILQEWHALLDGFTDVGAMFAKKQMLI
jgi:hypothetical protein